jgi:hypothetical protein
VDAVNSSVTNTFPVATKDANIENPDLCNNKFLATENKLK